MATAYWRARGIRPLEAFIAARVMVVTPPDGEPVSVEAVLAERRNDDDSDTAGIERRIMAARQRVETDTGRALMTQTVEIHFDAFPCGGELWLPCPPLQSVTSVTTHSTTDVSTVWSSSEYRVNTAGEPGRVLLGYGQSWPSGLREFDAVTVRAVVGYGDDEDDVPAPLRQAMHLLIGQFDEHRENVIVAQFAGQFLELPQGYDALIEPYRLRLN